MRFRHSLHSRIIFAFCLFGAVLGTAYATAVYISLDLIDDHLIDQRLREEVEYFTDHYKYHRLLPRTTSPYITAFMGTESMPLYVIELIEGLADGFHEAYSGPDEYHIAVQKLPDQENYLYLLYEVSALEFTEKRKLNIGFVMFGGVFLIILLGWWIGRLTSRKVIAPVIHLSDQVNKSGPGNLPTDLSKDYVNDEVGTLAVALEQSMKRIKAFVEREYQFTRDASHELRTPVTVIKGAVELLRQKLNPLEESVLRPLDRIQRQVINMENIIEALLWLSREEVSADPDQSFSVLPLVRDAIEENRQLIADKSIDINLVAEGKPVLNVPAPLFQIALTNLIHNAVRYTSNGHITVYVRDDRVLVSDTGIGIDASDLDKLTQPHVRGAVSNGFGLGLSIVSRLCDRFGWQFEMESEVGRGTTVHLIFRSAGTKKF
ncbi:MAG: HAMP domain-containing sensor histidine kinase [Desulfobacterales bacterium]|jgi:signal transduction histidine kinase